MKKYISLFFLTLALLIAPISMVAVFADSYEIENLDISICSNFVIQSETEFYCLNTQTQQIVHYNNGITSSFGAIGDQTSQYTQVQNLLILKNGEIVIYDKNLNKLLFYSNDFSFINEVRTIQMPSSSQTSLKSLENITNITSDIYSNVYLLDSSLNLILKANSTLPNFEIISQTSVSENAKFTFLNSTKDFAIQNQNSLSIKDISITLNSTPKSIFSDAKNFVYVVFEDKIEKYNANLTLTDSKQIENGNYYSINLETGTIFSLYNGKIETIENFATNIENQEPPVNAFDKIPLSSSAEIQLTTQNISLLNNPYSNKTILQIEQNQQVILLANSNSFETNFCYVLYKSASQNYFGYIEQKFLTEQESPNQNLSLIPTRNDVYYYKYPNSNESFKISALSQNKTYQSAKLITINDESFYEINLEESVVYVQNFELIDENYKYINSYIITNATISHFKGQNVIIYNDAQKTQILTEFSNQINVKLISNDSTTAQIEFMFQNQITTGFIDSKFITPQNNFTIPLTIILSTICIIVLIIIAIKFKKDKSKNKIITSY